MLAFDMLEAGEVGIVFVDTAGNPPKHMLTGARNAGCRLVAGPSTLWA
jgi:hypothetical protein